MNEYVGRVNVRAGPLTLPNRPFYTGSLRGIAQQSALFFTLGTAYGGGGMTRSSLSNLSSAGRPIGQHVARSGEASLSSTVSVFVQLTGK